MKHPPTVLNDRMSDYQHGFRPRRSCTTQLLPITGVSSKLIEDVRAVDPVHIDFPKNFDAAPHQRLLKKLETYGVSGRLLQWVVA